MHKIGVAYEGQSRESTRAAGVTPAARIEAVQDGLSRSQFRSARAAFACDLVDSEATVVLPEDEPPLDLSAAVVDFEAPAALPLVSLDACEEPLLPLWLPLDMPGIDMPGMLE